MRVGAAVVAVMIAVVEKWQQVQMQQRVTAEPSNPQVPRLEK